ncbi:MAG: hypothetical protein K1X72_02300 [Pyrinomonadaceae bacterium]|nr:hypothetical protein [Pyrinomonadaceae bacterium]
MSKLQKIIIFSFVLCLGLTNIFAQTTSNIVRHDLSQAEIDKIIKTFAHKESEFREALKNYIFNRYVVVQTVGLGGQITGELRRDSFMSIKENGERFEKVLFAPISTIGDIMTPEDFEDLGGVNPFTIEPESINQYNFNYLGKEKIDELNLYVFDISPKVIPDPKKSSQRMFVGRIWVDDQDIQIVKSKGKAVPETKINKFAIVETWRENVDGKYWFPSYALTTGKDGELVFDDGSVLRIKMRVKYTDYRQGRSDVIILDDDDPKAKPTPTPTPKKPE